MGLEQEEETLQQRMEFQGQGIITLKDIQLRAQPQEDCFSLEDQIQLQQKVETLLDQELIPHQ